MPVRPGSPTASRARPTGIKLLCGSRSAARVASRARDALVQVLVDQVLAQRLLDRIVVGRAVTVGADWRAAARGLGRFPAQRQPEVGYAHFQVRALYAAERNELNVVGLDTPGFFNAVIDDARQPGRVEL